MGNASEIINFRLNQTDFEEGGKRDAPYISKLELGKRQVCLEAIILFCEKLRMKPKANGGYLETFECGNNDELALGCPVIHSNDGKTASRNYLLYKVYSKSKY